MTLTRRHWLAATAAATAWPAAFAQTGGLKISHQFPSGTLEQGDFRDRLCRKFAAEVEKRSGGALKASVYPGSSLMKTNAQFSALRKGALDMSLVPLSYAGGEVAETNAGLMPALVPSYEQGAAWKTAEVGKLLMAPNVTTGRQKEDIKALVMDTTRREMIERIKEAVGEIRRNAEDVGEKFPEEARKIHYGEAEARGIIGQASLDEAEALLDEGIEIAALPHFPDDVN